ncbi:hypothetical protein [Paenibacillus sp. KS1]|uniref:hypothetical protein n=1 Tax=Paenibacillus sp. KS1 TaxID=1849249 RepID=UPI000A675343|nr:hypothetical protein [Paenibacillus sp. KS1]
MYSQIVDEIVSPYYGGDFIDTAFGKRKQGKFIMQYDEPDWAFLKRLASHVGALLAPDVASHTVRLWTGLPNGRMPFMLDENLPYEVHWVNTLCGGIAGSITGGMGNSGSELENINSFNRATSSASIWERAAEHSANAWLGAVEENGIAGVRTTCVSAYSFATYEFEHAGLLQLGDEVLLAGRRLSVIQRTGTMWQGLLRWTYVCAVREEVKCKRIDNAAIIGASIDGRIILVSRNQVKLHLDMDGQQDASKAQWFPYAAEGNQILYLMPELGARVKLYFPSCEEDDAMVIHSVRMQPQGDYAVKSEQKMMDPGVKSFGNPQGKEFTLGDKELMMTAQEGTLYISMNTYTGVNLHSSSQIRIQAAGSMNLTGKEVHLYGADGLSITTPSDTIELGEDVSMSSEKIELNAEKRQQFPQMMSAFEQELARDGEQAVRTRRIEANHAAQVTSQFQAYADEALGIWNTAVDVGDAVLSNALSREFDSRLIPMDSDRDDPDSGAIASVMSDALVRGAYQTATGESIGPLEERNDLVKGFQQGQAYIDDIRSGKKTAYDPMGDGEIG